MSSYFKPKYDITIKKSINEYFNYKQALSSLNPNTIKNRGYELNRFEKFCNKHKIFKPEDIHKNLLINYLKSLNISNSSKLGVIYTLIGYMDYLVDEELILENIASIIDKPKFYPPKTDYLNLTELETIFQTEAQNASQKVVDRNLLLFTLFTDICLRVSEVINLKLADVRIETKEVWVTRKRNKVERIPIHDDLVTQFQLWYDIRSDYKNADEKEWVFLSTHGRQLKPRQMHNIVSRALERAGIVKRKQGPHLLRHSGASLKAQAGENLITIQHLLGHENLNTTKRYLHFDWEDLKQMVNRSQTIKRS